MSSVLARAQVTMAEAAVESRSAQEDHADARLKQLDRRREAQADVLDETAETQDDLQQDLVEINDGPENKFLGWCGLSKEDKLRKLGNKIDENQAVAGEAAQKSELIESDQSAVFDDVKDANDRVSKTMANVQEAFQAINKAEAKGGVS